MIMTLICSQRFFSAELQKVCRTGSWLVQQSAAPLRDRYNLGVPGSILRSRALPMAWEKDQLGSSTIRIMRWGLLPASRGGPSTEAADQPAFSARFPPHRDGKEGNPKLLLIKIEYRAHSEIGVGSAGWDRSKTNDESAGANPTSPAKFLSIRAPADSDQFGAALASAAERTGTNKDPA